jgi:hypothetical protein
MLQATIPFDEIASGASVRCIPIDMVLYLSVRDVIMHISKCSIKTAHQTWGRLNDKQKEELAGNVKQFQFCGQGQSSQPVITVDGAMKLMMMLPGKRAKAMRVQAADILSRYVLGNESLIAEIRHNRQIGPAAACANLLEKACLYRELPQAAYLYATKSEAFPGLIKIGKSSDLTASLACLNTGCAPEPHYTVAVVPTFDAQRDKAWVHEYFKSSRREGEFFNVSHAEIKAFFNNQIMAKYQLELAGTIERAQGDFQ